MFRLEHSVDSPVLGSPRQNKWSIALPVIARTRWRDTATFFIDANTPS